ncbi:MAG: hypothetical protein ABJC79_06620 [Acidimicrobiia bacterium]
MTTSTRFARLAIVGMAAVAIAGCSSNAKSSDAAKKLKPAASVTKEAKSSTTTAPTSSSTGAPTTAPCTTAAAQTALAPDRAIDITCNGVFAAGSASNPQVDYAYLLQDVNGAWQKASTTVQNEVCTSNPQGLPASFVASACND